MSYTCVRAITSALPSPCRGCVILCGVCLQPLHVSSQMLTETNVFSRDQKLRSGRDLGVRVASLGLKTRAMAKELKDSKFIERSTCAGGPLDVDLWACLEDTLCVVQRRDMAIPGQ